MAVNVTRLGALGNSRHVAADTVGKRVNRMGGCFVQDRMAFEALGYDLPAEVKSAELALYHGDFIEGGRGEILLRASAEA